MTGLCLRDVLPMEDRPQFAGKAIADVHIPAEDLEWRRQVQEKYGILCDYAILWRW